ncbi:DNA repair protein RadA [Rickettsiales bacterium]|nr:DNA repair protein RadA [Rickettsiales bacterium]
MKATKNFYSCQECGSVHKKWTGKCPDCNSWNSLVEEYETGGGVTGSASGALSTNLTLKGEDLMNRNKIELANLDSGTVAIPRVNVGIEELDRVLGGGLVAGSAILIGGDPGIGKSTLLIQAAAALSSQNKQVFYISGEESVDQVRLRAKRLGLEKSGVKLASATNVLDILKTIDTKNLPSLVIIDSIQTMYVDILNSAPGTVSQVRACGSELTILAKKKNIALMIVSHVTKDGQIAGPKVLEHMVDTVLYFEGERSHQFRILRSIKNRFGAAGEIGVFEMNNYGLSQVNNPSELFLSASDLNVSGTSVFAGMEGSRPILVEIQALISPSFLPTPRRAVVGWDLNRLAMIIAVLNSRFGLNLSDKEVYLNIAGGLKINEPAADLSVALALISAAKDIVLPKNAAIMGEIGLSGEVRMVSHIDSRLKEAIKLGFENLILPAAIEKLKNWSKIKKDIGNVKIHLIGHIRDTIKFFK